MNPLLPAFLFAALGAAPLSAQIAGDTIEKKAAVDAMTPWLQELDKTEYDQAWEDASPQLKKSTTKEAWMASIQALREPLGRNTDRNLDSSLLQVSTTPPASDALPQVTAESVIAQYDASFENLKFALESVTFVKEPDGTWRAASYTVKAKTQVPAPGT